MAVSASVSANLSGQAGIEKLTRLLGGRTILKAIGLDQIRWIDDNFRKEGIEEKWAPLSENTVAQRRKGSSAILQDTGRLKMSFVTGQPVEESDTEIVVGSNEPTAEWHHFGTSPYVIRPRSGSRLSFMSARGRVFAGRVNHPGLPARPILPSEQMAARLAERVIQGLLNDAGS